MVSDILNFTKALWKLIPLLFNSAQFTFMVASRILRHLVLANILNAIAFHLIKNITPRIFSNSTKTILYYFICCLSSAFLPYYLIIAGIDPWAWIFKIVFQVLTPGLAIFILTVVVAVLMLSPTFLYNKGSAVEARKTATLPIPAIMNNEVYNMLRASNAAKNVFNHIVNQQAVKDEMVRSLEDFIRYSQYMYYDADSQKIIYYRIPSDDGVTRQLSIYNQMIIFHKKSHGLRIQRVVGKRTYDDSYTEHVLGLLPGALEDLVDTDTVPHDANNMTPEELFNQTYEKALLLVKSIKDSTDGIRQAYPGMGDFKRAWLEQVFNPVYYRPCPRDAHANAPGSHCNQKFIYNPDQKLYEQHTVEAKSGPKKVGVDRTDMQKNSFSLVVKGNCIIFNDPRSIAFAVSADESRIDDSYVWSGNARTYDKPWYNNDTNKPQDPSSFLGLQIRVQAVTTDYNNEVLARPSLSSLVGIIALKPNSFFSHLEALYNAETINCYNVVQNNTFPRVPVMIKNGDSFEPYEVDQLILDIITLLVRGGLQATQLLKRVRLICFKEVVPDYEGFSNLLISDSKLLSDSKCLQNLPVLAEEFINSVPESYKDNSRILLSGVEKYQSVDLSTATDDQILNIGKNTPQPIFGSEKVVLDRIKSTPKRTPLRSSGR